MRAEEAHRVTTISKSERLSTIYNRIMDTARMGNFNLTLLAKNLETDELLHLGENGYLLKAENGFITIDWSEADGENHEES